jgi:hypothetical protein
MIFHKVSPPVIHTDLFVAFTAFVVKNIAFHKNSKQLADFCNKGATEQFRGGFVVLVGLDFGAALLHVVVGEGDK